MVLTTPIFNDLKWGMKRQWQCKTSLKIMKNNSDTKPQIDKERENHSWATVPKPHPKVEVRCWILNVNSDMRYCSVTAGLAVQRWLAEPFRPRPPPSVKGHSAANCANLVALFNPTLDNLIRVQLPLVLKLDRFSVKKQRLRNRNFCFRLVSRQAHSVRTLC